jgi:hypothetical protein
MLYTIHDLIYYLILFVISLLHASLSKLNLVFGKSLTTFFYTGDSPNLSGRGYHNPGSNTFIRGGGTPLESQNLLLPTFFLQRALWLLPKVDYNIDLYKYRCVGGGFNILNTSSLKSSKAYVSIILYYSSEKRFGLVSAPSTHSTKLVGGSDTGHFYKNPIFSGVFASGTDFLSIFTLDFFNYKLLVGNIESGLLLNKQVK